MCSQFPPIYLTSSNPDIRTSYRIKYSEVAGKPFLANVQSLQLTVMLAWQFSQGKYLFLIMTYQVDILNPKATKLLQNLADLDLISIKETKEDGFLKIIKKLRAIASSNPPSLEEITKEVESVRAKRYAKEKK